MEAEDENDWLFDYVMSIFKAPTWEVPVMQFIDDNCIVFDNEEENKFSYTEIHNVRGVCLPFNHPMMLTLTFSL